jgi:predicted enzyme related to lactoylglutathione lyase
MEMLHNAVSWFEIPVNDFNRAKKFYSKIYDFEMPEMVMSNIRMGFLLYEQEKGGVGGAIVQGLEYVPSREGIKLYLNGGNDLQTVLDRVGAAGGKIILQKTQITPEYGYFATFEDTEGNFISLHSIK